MFALRKEGIFVSVFTFLVTYLAAGSFRFPAKNYVVLNKNNVKFALHKDEFEDNYSYNESYAPDAGASTGTTSVTSEVLSKAQGMNKRVLAVVLALVFVLTVVPTTIWIIVKGASAPTYPDLGLNAGNNYEIAALNSEVNSGTYSLKYNSRTYVFDLDFSPLDKLEKGDTIKFNTVSKEVEWTHNIETADRIDIKTVATLNESKSNDSHQTYQLKENNKIEAGKEYYLETGTDSDGQKTYIVFTPSETVTERTNGTYRGATQVTQKRDLDVVFYLEEEGTHSANSVAINGDEYNIKTIYTEATNLTANGIYLIVINSNDENYLVSYGMTFDGKVNQAYTDSTTVVILTTYTDNVASLDVYNPALKKVVAEVFSKNSNIYDLEKPLDVGQIYFDSTEESLSRLKFQGSDYFPEFQASPSNRPSPTIGYFFLRGYDGSTFSDKKRLGSIYNKQIGTNYNFDATSNIYLYDIDTSDHLFRTSSSDSAFAKYYYSDGSIWKYDNHNLINDQYFKLNAGEPGDPKKYLAASGTGVTRIEEEKKNVTLYEPNIAYSKTEKTVDTSGVEKAIAYTGKNSATPISYEETVSSDNGLELNKSVKALQNDMYEVTLEAQMTEKNIVRPDTDVMIVLDTSEAMLNKVYDSQYQNLKTYSEFEGVSTSNLTHDNLFDDDETESWIINAFSGAWQTLSNSRKYKHNKYVEDPNAPGTYVYLHQEYVSRVGSEGNVYSNYYRYHFTSSDGTQYST